MTDEALAERLYRAAINRPAGVPRLQYRCTTERCLLLDVIPLPDGNAVLHQLRYKYSPEQNDQRSSESGRQANTYDGENHWRERTYLLSQSALRFPEDGRMSGQQITCDHVLAYLLSATEFRDDLTAGHALVAVRPDGTRYAR